MPPANWQDFERLTLDSMKRVWSDQYAQRHGRSGQPQNGVDVFGKNYHNNEWTGVQCKKKTWATKPGADAPSNSLTTAEIDAELNKAASFTPPIARFVIATTAPADALLQKHVNLINAAGPSLQVNLRFWDDFVHDLNNDRNLMFLYYEDVLKYRGDYKADEHYYRLIRMAFDRPALRVPVQSENSADELDDALEHTTSAIQLGRLVDRDKKVIDETRRPNKVHSDLRLAIKALDNARKVLTEGRRRGDIANMNGWVMLRNPSDVQLIDRYRQEAVSHVNDALSANGVEILTP